MAFVGLAEGNAFKGVLTLRGWHGGYYSQTGDEGQRPGSWL